MNHNTRPEQRADVNGKIVTRHVKNDTSTKAPIVVPAPQIATSSTHPIAKSFFSHASDTDFSGMSAAEVTEAATAITTSISKDNMWDAMTVLTKAIETTDHPEELSAALGSNRAAVKIRDSWLEANGANLADRASYMEIEGEGGYADYKAAYSAFSNAYQTRLPDENANVLLQEEGNLDVKVHETAIKERTFPPTEAPPVVDDPYGDSLLAAGVSTDFKSMDERQTKEAATAVTHRIGPDTMWDALEVLTKCAQETEHPETMLVAMSDQGTVAKLRDSWLSKHGVNVAHRSDYIRIEGSEGYGRYRDEYSKLVGTLTKRVPNPEDIQALKKR